MTQKTTLTGREERAARLVAEDDQSDEAIASSLEMSRATLARLKLDPLFLERVQTIRQETSARVLRYAIAKRVRRVAALDDRWQRMQRLIDARAEEYAAVPGGDTGLLVRQLKRIGQGRDAETVEEYAADVALLRELRETEKQAAQEVGQWADKASVELSGPAGGPLSVKGEFDFDSYNRLFASVVGVALGEPDPAGADDPPQPLDPAHPDA